MWHWARLPGKSGCFLFPCLNDCQGAVALASIISNMLEGTLLRPFLVSESLLKALMKLFRDRNRVVRADQSIENYTFISKVGIVT